MNTVSKYLSAGAIAFAVFGCASSPDELEKTQIPADQYTSHDCQMLGNEFQRNDVRTQELYRHLKEERDDDVAAAWIGGVLFWPALFALEGGDGVDAEEFSRLRGEREALERETIVKKCDVAIVPEDPVDVIKRELAKEKEERQMQAEAAQKNNPYSK